MAEMHDPTEHVPIDNLVEAAMVHCHILGTRLGYTEQGDDAEIPGAESAPPISDPPVVQESSLDRLVATPTDTSRPETVPNYQLGQDTTDEIFCIAALIPGICFDDTLYLGDTFFGDGVAEEMDPAEIGPLLFTVTGNSLDAMESCDWIPANGDSSLPIGAEVSELVSQDVSVAVVANYGGQFFVYWADRD